MASEWKKGDLTLRLIFINSIVFLVVNILFLLFDNLGAGWSQYVFYLASSSSPAYLLFHPWTLVTHMFTHENFGHWLWNMVALYFSATIFTHFLGKKKLLTTYLVAGFSGFLLYFLAFNLIPSLGGHGSVLGASAAIMGVLLAAAATAPEFELSIWGIINIKLKYLAAIYVILDVVGLRDGWNSGGHIAHLGGALFGFVYARQLKDSRNITSWAEMWVGILFFGDKRKKTKLVKLRSDTFRSDEEFNLEKKERQKRVDDILDKISRSGYESLTREEKDFLFRYSQK